MQILATTGRNRLEARLRSVLELPSTTSFRWHSPVGEDGWAEYRDRSFLQRVGLAHLAPKLREFWPRGGPQWDGLLSTPDHLILIEAKAHVRELASSCAASFRSREQIRRALDEARAHFGASRSADWLNGYYQYANRLAHLHFLRANGVDAHLVFLYFTGDTEMRGPASAREWEDALTGVYLHLGLNPNEGTAAVHSLHVDVDDLGPHPRA